MGRNKQFNQQAVLEDAMHLFWARGFHSTSMQDLVDHLGVNRQSLYDTFGGKHELFEAALERYREMQGVPALRALEQVGSVGDVLRKFFRSMIEQWLKNNGQGCLLVNTATELAADDEAIFGVCSGNARQLEAVFSGLLARAQQAGEMPADRAVIPLARFLVSTINGLAVTAKATRDPEVLNDVVEVALSALDL